MEFGIHKFVESRIDEVHELSRQINAARPKLIFQRLPQHMKRRMMGHTCKRIPRNILQQHLKQQAKSGQPTSSKAPSRKHRRRPVNARLEFQKRECKKRWLETHLWHAKRFHMVEKWGFKIAHHPNDRSWRACWRAITGHCLLLDLSYLTCIQCVGGEDMILKLFKLITIDGCKDDVFDCDVISGKKEGKLVLYGQNSVPESCLGFVRLIWKPSLENVRTVWFWCNPGARGEILDAVTKAAQGNVEVEELDGKLSRFRLTGPLTVPVLRDALTMYDENPPRWLDTDLLEKQQSAWGLFKNTTVTLPGQILGLTVTGPKKSGILKRHKALNSPEPTEPADIKLPDVPDSQLWDPKITHKMQSCKETSIPIILVNQPAADGRVGQGWDVIAPRGHGLSVWLRLIYGGARVGGLREHQMLNWNTLNKEDLCFYPDTPVGHLEEIDLAKKEEEKFNSLPTNKRAGATLFSIPWLTLLEEWSQGAFFVQRNEQQLSAVRSFFTSPTAEPVGLQSEGLVAISISLVAGGTLERGSVVCLPALKEDFLKPVEEDKQHLALQRHHINTRAGMKISELFCREVAGFVAVGEFDFQKGCHAGVAFITSSAVNVLCGTFQWNEHLQVLVKNKNSPFYRKATVKII